MAAVERARAGAESRLEAARALPAAYLRAVFSSAQAQQWPRRRLGEICEILAGFAWPSGGFSDRGLPVIRIQNLGDNDRARFAYWSGSYEEDYVVQNGDLLISLSGTVPVSFKAEIWSRGPALLNQRIVRLRAKGDGVSLEWLARNVTFQLENIFGKAAGSTGIANAKMGVVTALDVPVPTLADQQRVVAILRQQMAEAERVLKVVEEELAAISALPAALLRRAFSGAL
jgi:type I restriction enzyme S subunit